MNIRNRISGHRRVRAGDLVPHELNFRTHPQRQRQALAALYQEIGFARSLLAYALPDGRLKLLDGHLRRDLDPDMVVDVEVLDVNDDEARALLLSIDPLAALAEANVQTLARLQQETHAESPALTDFWRSLTQGQDRAQSVLQAAGRTPAEQFLVLIECRDEAHQVELLSQFSADGLHCRALVS